MNKKKQQCCNCNCHYFIPLIIIDNIPRTKGKQGTEQFRRAQQLSHKLDGDTPSIVLSKYRNLEITIDFNTKKATWAMSN
jgi:hypothetical protein